MGHSHQICPDKGVCHHQCDQMCFRVLSCGPLSGVYPGDRWPDDVLAEHGMGQKPLTPRRRTVLGESMSIPHPSTRYFMGHEHTQEEMNRRENEAMDDDVILVWTRHIWPLMGYLEADARWKTGQTKEVELYSLCGLRLRSYTQKHDGTPIEMGWHWSDGATNHEPGGIAYDDQPEMCGECLDKWTAASE